MTVRNLERVLFSAKPAHQTNTKLRHWHVRLSDSQNPMRRTPPPRPTTSSLRPESSQPIQQEEQGPRRAAGLSEIPASIIFSIFVLLHPQDLVNVRNACYTFKAIVEDIDGDSPIRGPFPKGAAHVSNWSNPNLISKHGIRLPQSLQHSALGLYRGELIVKYCFPHRQLPGCMCIPIAGTPGHVPLPPRPPHPPPAMSCRRWQPSSCRLCDTGPLWRKLPPSFAAAVVARFGLPIDLLALLHMGLALRLAHGSERRLLAPNVAALSLGLTYLASGQEVEIRADEFPKIPLDALLADSRYVLKVLCLTAAGPADWSKGARRSKECGGELMHRCVARAALRAAGEAGRSDFARVVIERDGRLFNL
ncbi:hypothetical protein DFJ73DRAFT_811400 [Zopfochytrium polystomum]|nr:hypothetical protein DFJ73DRAFT_811400 [Zopfochytrium polystomum]